MTAKIAPPNIGSAGFTHIIGSRFRKRSIPSARSANSHLIGIYKPVRLLKSPINVYVRFLGFIEPAAFYSQIDVLVVPSLWHEPFPGVIIEAYSYAIPVIAAARGGIPEIVEDMVTGLLFDPDRPETLRASLQAFLDDRSLASTLGANAYRKAQEFSANRTCQEYDAVYSR